MSMMDIDIVVDPWLSIVDKNKPLFPPEHHPLWSQVTPLDITRSILFRYQRSHTQSILLRPPQPSMLYGIDLFFLYFILVYQIHKNHEKDKYIFSMRFFSTNYVNFTYITINTLATSGYRFSWKTWKYRCSNRMDIDGQSKWLDHTVSL